MIAVFGRDCRLIFELRLLLIGWLLIISVEKMMFLQGFSVL
jgi:hypothetical protein